MNTIKKGLLTAATATTLGLAGCLIATPAFATPGESQGAAHANAHANVANNGNGNGNGNGNQCNSNANRDNANANNGNGNNGNGNNGNGNNGNGNGNSNANDRGWRAKCIQEAVMTADRGVASNTGDVNGLAGGIALGLAGAAAATGALVRIRLR